MFLRPFGWYCSACFGILFVSIVCTCCSQFSWYCFIYFTVFCAPVFSLMHWLFSLSTFVIPSKCLKNFICDASKRCSYLFFSTQASLPNFNAALAVMLGKLRNVIHCYWFLSLCNEQQVACLISCVSSCLVNTVSYLIAKQSFWLKWVWLQDVARVGIFEDYWY